MRGTGSLRQDALCGVLVVFAGCSGLPPRPTDAGGPPSAVVDAGMTRLSRSIEPRVAAHRGKTGIWSLADPRDAFASRVLLADAAERTLDVQYYIWHGDLTGTLLLRALLDAADRGVRVRLLIDDSGTSGLDDELMAIAAHPNVAVRLFNPFVIRSPKWLGFLTDFGRANRRMHNKSFTADGEATIVGGRNVGDEYFGATNGVLFADLDVLAIGPAAHEVSNDFERYWTSASVYPAASILPPVDASRRAALRERAAAIERDAKARAYVEALGTSQSIRALVRGDLQFEWAETRMVSDDPDKGLAGAPEPDLMFHQLGDIFGAPTRRFDLVSPYFVPTETGVEWFAAMARRGVRVRILTNSLEATDVAAVHAGYAKHRKTLLEAGVTLYEMRRESGEGQGKGKVKGSGPFGNSSSSLHAKTFAVDGTRVFVGSFNFDPRSARLNTELGLVIDSPVLAGRVETTFDRTVPRLAYQVHLDAEGNLYWLEQVDGRTVRHDTEPGTGALERFGISVLSVLPIDWML